MKGPGIYVNSCLQCVRRETIPLEVIYRPALFCQSGELLPLRGVKYPYNSLEVIPPSVEIKLLRHAERIKCLLGGVVLVYLSNVFL